MALRAVPDHPKFARLKRILGFGKGRCLGYLEGVWHFAGRFAPHGDIGKYADADIESWVEWEGESSVLINALIDAGWIDRCEQHRLVVHDWHQHADNATKLAVKRSKRDFVSTVSAMSRQCGDTVEETPTPLRLPEPEPVPEPVPEPEPEPEPVMGLPVLRVAIPPMVFDGSMVSKAVLSETGLSGQELSRNLAEVAFALISKGEDGRALVDEFTGAITAYREALSQRKLTQYAHPLAKFIGEGVWRDRNLWRWKEGQSPARAGPDPLEELRKEREAALREKQRLEGNGKDDQ